MKYLLLFIVFALLAVFFLQEGITGLVIGQSCCFPSESCFQENVCDVARTEKPAVVNYLFIIVGIKIIIFLFFVFYRKARHQQALPLSKIFKQS